MFRISYKKIIKKVMSFTPELSTIKGNISLPKSKDEKENNEWKTPKVKKELEQIEKMKKELEEELFKSKKIT